MLPQSTFDKLSCMVITTDSEGKISLVTDGFLRKTGYTRDNLLGEPFQNITTTDLSKIPANETQELYLQIKDSYQNIVSTIVSITYDPDTGTCLYSFMDISLGSYMDKVHELSRREAEIFALRREMENISSYTPIGLWRCDTNGQMTWINDRFAALFHIPKNQCLGNGWLSVVSGEQEHFQQIWKQRLTSDRVGYDLPIATPAGEHWVRLTGNRAGIIEAGYVGTVRDVTFERNLLPLLEELKD